MYRFWLVMDPDTREWLKRLFTAWSFLKNPIVEAIAFVSILVPQRAALPAANVSAREKETDVIQKYVDRELKKEKERFAWAQEELRKEKVKVAKYEKRLRDLDEEGFEEVLRKEKVKSAGPLPHWCEAHPLFHSERNAAYIGDAACSQVASLAARPQQ